MMDSLLGLLECSLFPAMRISWGAVTEKNLQCVCLLWAVELLRKGMTGLCSPAIGSSSPGKPPETEVY